MLLIDNPVYSCKKKFLGFLTLVRKIGSATPSRAPNLLCAPVCLAMQPDRQVGPRLCFHSIRA